MINLKEHNDKIREKVQQMFLEDSVSYVSEKVYIIKKFQKIKKKLLIQS